MRAMPCRMSVALIGFGEAARTFVAGGLGATAAFDIDPAKREGIAAVDDPGLAFGSAKALLSVVTADQAFAAVQTYSRLLSPNAFYFDMNSVAPETKRAAAQVIADIGGRYLDVAIMAPVYPVGLSVPLLVSGPNAVTGVDQLSAMGFSNVRAVGDEIGRASSIKMLRSVMIKGIEALTAEMMLGAREAGVEDEVLASLGDGWTEKTAYNLERMAIHGKRRAAEMEEVAKTLASLGIDPVMTRGTIVRQKEMAA
jgi:3-hydroxyisobutyrate dehydrogenase-like beta-hydroxyacid dehydrogenase